jgi:hypothetical protein
LPDQAPILLSPTAMLAIEGVRYRIENRAFSRAIVAGDAPQG